MMLRILLLTFISGNLAASFSYDRCDKDKGPSKWGGSCQSGTQGTPIDLCGATEFPSTYTQKSFTVDKWNKERSVNILESEYTVQINIIDDNPTTQVGSLAAVVGRGTATTNYLWKLEQMHIHIGRSDRVNEGSEHYMQGRAYPMEIHFVHYNSNIATSVTTAVATGKPEALLVVGVFIEIGTSSDATLAAMASAAAAETAAPTLLGTKVNLNSLFDGSGTFYAYAGSLTTPGCLEQVTWVVMKASKKITEADLKNFKAAKSEPTTSLMQKFNIQGDGTQGEFGTFRPLQARNGRPLYSSSGATDACGTVTEPKFSCSSVVLSCPSLLVAFLALGFWATQL